MMLVVAALVLIKPGWLSDLAGVAPITLTLASQCWFGAQTTGKAKEPA